jgi:type IV pilus assembly protein PilB
MRGVKVDPAWALRIPPALALRRQVLPFACVDERVYVACANLEDQAAFEAVARFVGKKVQPELADPETLRPLIQRIFGSMQNSAGSESRPVVRGELKISGEAEPTDVVPICDELLFAALVREASDIHLDPGPEVLTVRLRVDGYLEPYRSLPLSFHASVISRFKVLSGMDIAEKRSPQDGGFTHRYGNSTQAVDIRVATLPTKYGERMTLRLLAMQTETLTVEKLGMSPRDQQMFERMIAMPHGMILLTGPTGSGKTTTLYSALRRLIQMQVGNIITIEDPIEYAIPGVAQVEVDSADKISFSRALRSVLRHDPDVVMIGEIRDHETADVAIKASLTGHLVFSTLHTNSAAGVVTRMMDMGVERYLIGATLRLAVTQRLVRKLCSYCRIVRPLTTAEAISLGRPDDAGREVADAGGCKYCANRGYGGRFGLFEMLPSDEELSRRIAVGCSESELISYSRDRGWGLLIDDAAEKLFSFTTSLREIMEAVATW